MVNIVYFVILFCCNVFNNLSPSDTSQHHTQKKRLPNPQIEIKDRQTQRAAVKEKIVQWHDTFEEEHGNKPDKKDKVAIRLGAFSALL